MMTFREDDSGKTSVHFEIQKSPWKLIECSIPLERISTSPELEPSSSSQRPQAKAQAPD
jgi:hypothetical protein